MFNLFKKQPNIDVVLVDDLMEKSGTSIAPYPKEVLAIHHEFHTAADLLVVEANSILAEAKSKDTGKVSRLESLGFKQAGQVVELKPLLKQAELSQEQLTLLAYYQLNYPNNKFITEEQVKTICHKYNLVCGDVSRFKGFVPEKNLRDIEKFNLKKDDLEEWYYYGSTWDKISNHKITHGHDDSYFDIARLDNNPKKYQKRGAKLKICAPIKDMDISGLELKEGYKLEKKFIPDPVVLQPVKGGYLILSAWGTESEDPIVVNEKMN